MNKFDVSEIVKNLEVEPVDALDTDIVESVLVILASRSEDGSQSLTMAAPKSMGWVTQLGLLHGALAVLNAADVEQTPSDD
jgi:hypothetical protein